MSEVTNREPCPVCRAEGADSSGDNLVRYDDGHGFCFACGTFFPAEGLPEAELKERRKAMAKLVAPGIYKAIPSRKLKKETCEKFGYTVGPVNGKGAHIAPYHDVKGNLVAQHIRHEGKVFKWVGEFSKVVLFGQHLWGQGGKRVIITEGELDAMSVSQIQGNRWPVVSVPSGAMQAKKAVTKSLEWLESYQEVVIMFDNDDAGLKAAQECAILFSPGKAKIAQLPLKDANEMLVAGRVDEILTAIYQAKPYRPDGVLNGSDLWDVIRSEPTVGFLLPYPRLQDMTMGMRKGELWLWTAGSGIGKSTAVHELAYHLMMKHGLSIGVLALEESVKMAGERYLGIYLNKPLHRNREGVTEDDLKHAYDETIGRGDFWIYDHFGSTDIDTLLSKIRYMVVGLGVDILVLDHISIVVSGLDEQGESERKLIDIFMTRLRSLIQETGVGVLAVVHLRRPGQGKSWNEGRQVSLTDLRGSGSLEQLSDVVIALERDQQDEERRDIATLRVLKNRPVGMCGGADSLRYMHETGRLLLEEETCPFTSGGVSDF